MGKDDEQGWGNPSCNLKCVYTWCHSGTFWKHPESTAPAETLHPPPTFPNNKSFTFFQLPHLYNIQGLEQSPPQTQM